MFILQRAFLTLNYTFVNGQIFLGIGNYKSHTTLFKIFQNFKIYFKTSIFQKSFITCKWGAL